MQALPASTALSTSPLRLRSISRANTDRLLVAGCSLMIAGILSSTASLAPAAGVVFLNANSASNEVWMYKRANNGQLSLVGAFPTQGVGSGTTELASQGSVALANSNKFLYAVNAVSNEITAFQVKSNALTFVGKVASGGTFPNSVAAFGSVLYVLNAQGTAANISGFRIRSNGSLVAIPNSTRPLSSALPVPAQVGFTPDGETLLVSEKIADNIDTYAMGADGLATGPTAQASAGSGPFGFDFDNAAHLVISEIGRSSASSYTVSAGLLQVVTARLTDYGKAACWVVNTKDPALPQQYSYITNTHSDTVSGFAIATDGSISLLDADGKTAVLPVGAYPLDMAMSKDSKYLYVLEGHLPAIAGFQIQSDGSLLQIQDLRGMPLTSWGMIGY